MDVTIVAGEEDVTPFPSAAVSMNAPDYTMGMIQAGAHDLAATEDEDGIRPLDHLSSVGVFMISAAEGASTETTMVDHPVFSTKFILDSGATAHVTGNASLFPCLIPVHQGGKIRAANGHQLDIRGFGAVVMENFRVNNVLYVPGLSCNAISLSRLIKLDYSVSFSRAGCLIKDIRTGETVGNARLVDGLYRFDRLEIPLDRTPTVAP
ncbi:unnamed protein product [Urochloa decumbens]|uniref:Retrovirus-related Pol polyprotein from transposon TNT 1-94-like beta-barrel domain-containing protein n=1 Tax=Urochloa decumbens TaxID=240449 RepID=A0ABC9AW56_9POAL